MATIKDRLFEYLGYLHITQQRFEQSVGLSNGWCSKIGDSIRKNTLDKISERYKDLNTVWLISGVGGMLLSDQTVSDMGSGEDDIGTETTARMVPLLPLSAQGGTLNDFVVQVKSSDCEMVVCPIRGADFAIPVSGDSMSPEYPNGSTVFIKKINEKAYIEWGRVYVLDTCNGTVIKTLIPSDKEGWVRCISINKSPQYAPFDICLKDVFGIYRVLLCMSVK